MATIFSRIVAGEIPSYKVAENDKFYAFLDIAPLAKGHTLVIPKREVDYFYDLEDDELAEMIVCQYHNIDQQNSQYQMQVQNPFVLVLQKDCLSIAM